MSSRDRQAGTSGSDRQTGTTSGRDRQTGTTSGRDRQTGTSSRDRQTGTTSGSDRQAGTSGRDRQAGTSGRDRQAGTSGRDRQAGTSGRDRQASTTSGSDRQAGTSGRDRQAGTSGRDRQAVTTSSRDRQAVTTSSRDRQTGTTSGRDRQAGTTSSRDRHVGTSGGDRQAGTSSLEAAVGVNEIQMKPPHPDRVMAFDPLTATPRRTFCINNSQLKAQGDPYKYPPYIQSLVVTDGGKIVMTDWFNNNVKVMDSRTLTIVGSLSLGVSPWGLALLEDKLLAVTSDMDYVIHLIDVTGQLRVVRRIKTTKKYSGVGCGGNDCTLVVSCKKRVESKASIDIVSREGQLLRTVVDDEDLSDLRKPYHLYVVGGAAFVSENLSNKVFRVDLATGRVMATHTHDQLKSPYQVSADRSGNLFIASRLGRCVLVMGVDGRWRTLLRREEHGEGKYVEPHCVAVTDTGVIVAWSLPIESESVVTGFDLT